MTTKVRLIDVSKCVGCKGCQVSCKNWNQLPATPTEFSGSYESPPDLFPNTWSRVKFNEYADSDKVKFYFSFFSCMHCSDPACLNICPVKAISKDSLGSVKVDLGVCIGCGACKGVCPFNVPRIGNNKMFKCTLCSARVSNGMASACATACPTGAISLGDADEKIAEAEARVAELKKSGFANARIYGKDELGGLGVIYVLTDAPDKYGLPAEPKVSLADVYFWKVALGPVKTLATVGLAAGALSGWLQMRKEEIRKEQEGKE